MKLFCNGSSPPLEVKFRRKILSLDPSTWKFSESIIRVWIDSIPILLRSHWSFTIGRSQKWSWLGKVFEFRKCLWLSVKQKKSAFLQYKKPAFKKEVRGGGARFLLDFTEKLAENAWRPFLTTVSYSVKKLFFLRFLKSCQQAFEIQKTYRVKIVSVNVQFGRSNNVRAGSICGRSIFKNHDFFTVYWSEHDFL